MSAAMQALKSSRIVNTERLMMIPPGKENLPDLAKLKADERVFGWMLHGTRSAERTAEELEDDIDFWEVRGYGTWCVFERESGEFLGICGLMERPDGRGVALRYGTRYTVTFRKGLPSATGETLVKSVPVTGYVRDRAPQVSFAGQAYILPRGADQGLPVQTVNLMNKMA